MDTEEALLEAQIDRTLEIMLSAKDVGPKARHKLRHLIRHYMKKPHPFTSCYRDNVKRFGPERAKRVCAVLKDLGVGHTKWRKGAKKTKLSEETSNEPDPEITDEIAEILDSAYEDEDFKKFLTKLRD